MADIDWMLDDLRILRDRFREARRTYPGLISRFAEFPRDGRVWHVDGWRPVGSFASIHDVSDFELSPHEMPSVNYLFLRMAETCLARAPGAGWDLRAAVACFGQLAMETVSTLHLYEVTRSISEHFWWSCDERAWIAWLHLESCTPIPEELVMAQRRDGDLFGEESKLVREKVPVKIIDDVFEAACRHIDFIINAFGDSTIQHQLPGNAPPWAAPELPLVTLHPPEIKFGGTSYRVSPDGATFVQFLLNAKGDWRPGSKMGMRADRVRLSLPEPISKLIEGIPGKGYRLNRELWEVA
jgi:hypothetical protein